MSENKIGKYLEGDYDGQSVGETLAQASNDIAEALSLVQEAERKQEEAKEKEKERIAEQYDAEGKALDKIFADYAKEDKFGEYLVDGAILRCNQATLEDFPMPDGEPSICLEKGSNSENEKRKETILNVAENPISDNGKNYATVSDYVLNKNVMPFACNCKRQADRKTEINKIKADPECNKYGVCRHLIRLENEWENYSLDNMK